MGRRGCVAAEEGRGGLFLAEWFDMMNDGLWHESQRGSCDVISFSHFLPLQVGYPTSFFKCFRVHIVDQDTFLTTC